MAVLFLPFTYPGFDSCGILASLGLISLAVSIGSRDLVTDLLAGMSIVFEGEFHVGDMVDVADCRGKVQKIGVRSTKFIGRDGNIKIIGNRDVKNVINLTRLNSWYLAELSISNVQLLETIEEILNRELSKNGKEIEKIISGLS